MQNENDAPVYQEGEAWWATLESSFGFEEGGKGPSNERPVVIVRGFNERLVWVVPLSTTAKRNRYYLPFVLKPGQVSVAILSQLRSLDTLRLLSRIGVMEPKDFALLKERLRSLL